MKSDYRRLNPALGCRLSLLIPYFVGFVAFGVGQTSSAPDATSRAVGAALQGNATAAVKILSEVSGAAFAGVDSKFRDCMLTRFAPASSANLDSTSGDPWMDSLAKKYLQYWHLALMSPEARADAEKELRTQLSGLLSRAIQNDEDFDKAEDLIQQEARKRGFYLLLGRTAPLRELMMWKKLTIEKRDVQLPEGPYTVKVHFLDDFVLRGWGYYATCGRRSAGGWATEEGLFAVVPAYKSLSDETFSVRFLAHETQHFADKARFGSLESWELEYRAKLVELGLAQTSQDSTLKLMCENRSEKKDSSHAYANMLVVRNLNQRLAKEGAALCSSKQLPPESIRRTAQELLREDSERRPPSKKN